ncbi:hypothetical protein F2P47_11385 [Parvibaculum sedimenti]|uniref:DUF7064 domain-containing protein n=1 Tax=Parvibaculum sedimenti TaxID=2608632 RepID=A0A6N6VM00_9HYPH|nr:hypothetical protein [Parvibaculum sedimenti]KAB7739673.1 hypothetical protein F2P47_11385 [Parvibaculum sedimenti]
MAKPPAGFKIRLAPEDEYTHQPDAAMNYNESMYFNMFDPARKTGGWFRIGNRPNEGYAEVSVCLYLPDGRVGFMYAKPKISDNKEMNAGGFRVQVVEPFKRLRVTYDGKICLLKEPNDMAEPGKAFKNNPILPCKVELDYEGVSPMFGGETVKEDGSALDIDPEKSFAKAHYEQHVAASGSFVIGDERFEVSGFGLRDKSWGPRYWQAIHWYRWCPMNFGRDFGMMLSIVAGEKGEPRQGGMVLKDGKYDLITEVSIDSDWDENWYQTGFRSHIKTESGATYDVDAKVLSLIPLRNRRQDADGNELVTRITEGMTEYRCNGQVGYGLSEYLDQIVDGKPVSIGG